MSTLFEITNDIEQLFEGAANSLLSPIFGLAKKVTLIFDTTEVADCPNCYSIYLLGTSSSRYNTNNGNPLGPLNIPFTTGKCQVCHGIGRIENPVPKQLVVNMIALPMSFLDLYKDINISVPDTDYYAIGFMSDKNNINVCSRAIMRGDTVQRNGPISPFGLKTDKYIETYWKKIQ